VRPINVVPRRTERSASAGSRALSAPTAPKHASGPHFEPSGAGSALGVGVARANTRAAARADTASTEVSFGAAGSVTFAAGCVVPAGESVVPATASVPGWLTGSDAPAGSDVPAAGPVAGWAPGSVAPAAESVAGGLAPAGGSVGVVAGAGAGGLAPAGGSVGVVAGAGAGGLALAAGSVGVAAGSGPGGLVPAGGSVGVAAGSVAGGLVPAAGSAVAAAAPLVSAVPAAGRIVGPVATVLAAPSATPGGLLVGAGGCAKALGQHAVTRAPMRTSMASHVRRERRSGRWLHGSDRKNLLKAS
jgi:hypothetical protein